MHIFMLYDVMYRLPINPFKVEGYSYEYNRDNYTVTVNKGRKNRLSLVVSCGRYRRGLVSIVLKIVGG